MVLQGACHEEGEWITICVHDDDRNLEHEDDDYGTHTWQVHGGGQGRCICGQEHMTGVHDRCTCRGCTSVEGVAHGYVWRSAVLWMCVAQCCAVDVCSAVLCCAVLWHSWPCDCACPRLLLLKLDPGPATVPKANNDEFPDPKPNITLTTQGLTLNRPSRIVAYYTTTGYPSLP